MTKLFSAALVLGAVRLGHAKPRSSHMGSQ
jgi:hypothetical protein